MPERSNSNSVGYCCSRLRGRYFLLLLSHLSSRLPAKYFAAGEGMRGGRKTCVLCLPISYASTTEKKALVASFYTCF